MKIETAKFSAMAHRHLLLLPLVLLGLAGPAQGQVFIGLDNSNQQSFALDTANHFLYTAEGSNAGTKHLSVINTLTNTVVGSYNYSSGGYTSQVAASGTNIFWADQGSSQVKVFSVNGSGVPSLTRNDSATLATGVAALGTTYGVSMQGTGDKLNINLISNGSSSFANISLGGVAGQVFADSNTNRYYARATNSYTIINAGTGSVLGSLSGYVMAVDSASAHNFVYLQDSGSTSRLDQLAGSVTNNTVNTYYDFASAISDVTVNSANGDIFVALGALNQVVQLNSSMALLNQYSVTNPQTLAFADGELFVHSAGTAYLTAIAIPEPATWSAMLGGLGLVAVILRRRAARRSS